MAAVLTFPIGQRLQQDMQRMFGEPASVTVLRDERVTRNREASERRYEATHGPDFDPDLPGAA
ncbi:MAG TPA: hypothetical protein VLC71_06075 [Thermomonas sp.]|nr:hypothetical protein [Thermomonas sp.]